MPAQGNALGTGSGDENSRALKGHNRRVVENLVSPLQGWADSHSDRIPRALPWAFLFRPLRGGRKAQPQNSQGGGKGSLARNVIPSRATKTRVSKPSLQLGQHQLFTGPGRARPERLVFMRKRLRLPGLPRLGLALGLGLLALLTTTAKADLSVTGLGLYDGSSAPIVEIKCTGDSGVWVYGDAQTATNWTFPNGSSIPLYCIDLTHDNAVGDCYALKPWSSPSFSTSSYSNAANRIAWAIENGGLSGIGTAATQGVTRHRLSLAGATWPRRSCRQPAPR